MNDSVIITVALVFAFIWLSMRNAMAALCTGCGISSGQGPSSLIGSTCQFITPGFGPRYRYCSQVPKPQIVMGMAPQAILLPKPMGTMPRTANTPALCEYIALETTPPETVVQDVITNNPIGLLVKNLTECFCKVNKLYGQALLQGYSSGKISRCAPTPARYAAQLRCQLHATSGVRRAALGCCVG